MTHEEGAGDSLVAIQGRLDKIDDTLVGHGHMLKMHGIHFGTLEAMLSEHTALLIAHNRRFDGVDAILKAHDRRFDQVDVKLAEHDARFDQIDEMLGKILARLDAPRP
jgi:hypothetical protein